MRYFTHHFARPETLERARRWLIQVGFDDSSIESRAEGIPRLTVHIRGSQLPQVSMIIRAAESTDPRGWPSYWDLMRMKPIAAESIAAHPPEPLGLTGPHSFPMEWHPQDSPDAAALPNIENARIREAYIDRGA